MFKNLHSSLEMWGSSNKMLVNSLKNFLLCVWTMEEDEGQRQHTLCSTISAAYKSILVYEI